MANRILFTLLTVYILLVSVSVAVAGAPASVTPLPISLDGILLFLQTLGL